MPKTIVLDTSVIIDLHRGSMVKALFDLKFAFAVPDFLYSRELAPPNTIGEYLQSLGLSIVQVDARGVILAEEYARRCRSLSTSDSLALALAKRKRYAMLTGDKVLREFGQEVGVQCNGLLAAFDWIEQAGLMSLATLYSSLLTISKHDRARLPHEEIAIRMKRYSEPTNDKTV